MTFSKKIQIDISDFDYGEYFNSEPTWSSATSKKKTLTAGILTRAVVEGKFLDI